MSDTEKSTNENIKQEIKQELHEVQNILEDNIDDVLRTNSLGLAGKYNVLVILCYLKFSRAI